MVCVRFTKMWPTTKIQVRDISEILKSVCVGPSAQKVGGSSNAIKRVDGANLLLGPIFLEVRPPKLYNLGAPWENKNFRVNA